MITLNGARTIHVCNFSSSISGLYLSFCFCFLSCLFDRFFFIHLFIWFVLNGLGGVSIVGRYEFDYLYGEVRCGYQWAYLFRWHSFV